MSPERPFSAASSIPPRSPRRLALAFSSKSPSTFTGGITNSGTITAGGDGIHIALSPAFTVSIVNSTGGTISVHGTGIAVSLLDRLGQH